MAKEFGNKSSTKVLLYLLGLTVVYQGMYHLCITLPFSANEYFAQYRSNAMTQAIHPCHGETASQAQCIESELFRSWSKLESSDPKEYEDRMVPSWAGDEQNGPDLMALDPIGRVVLAGGQSLSLDTASNSSVSVDVPSNSTRTLVSSQAPKVESDLRTSVAPKEEELAASVEKHDLHSEAVHSEAVVSTGYENTHVTTLIKGSTYEATEWGRGLIELETQLENLKANYDHQQKRRAANSNLKDHVARLKDRSLLEQIEDLLREMCEDPWRRGRETCARFLTPMERHEAAKAKLHSRLAQLAKGRLEWERSFVHRAKRIGKQMCMERQRQNDTVCESFMADVPTSAPGRVLSMAFSRDRATRSAAEQGKRREQPTQVDQKVLHASKWAAKIPKVECIMEVPNTTQAHARVKHAVNNFRTQKYEGPTQLLMVYHYQDQQTAHLLKRFADGAYIKALPARTSVPSTTALRYGAWVAGNDTDVVARWDLDTWHHPHRLAMQVRALGLTGLPISLLGRRTLVTNDGHTPVMYLEDGFQGASSVGFGWPESLVAERSWAEKNWAPHLIGEWASLAASPGLVSLLDMPELQAYSVDDSLEHTTAGEKIMQDTEKNKEQEHAPQTALVLN